MTHIEENLLRMERKRWGRKSSSINLEVKKRENCGGTHFKRKSPLTCKENERNRGSERKMIGYIYFFCFGLYEYNIIGKYFFLLLLSILLFLLIFSLLINFINQTKHKREHIRKSRFENQEWTISDDTI